MAQKLTSKTQSKTIFSIAKSKIPIDKSMKMLLDCMCVVFGGPTHRTDVSEEDRTRDKALRKKINKGQPAVNYPPNLSIILVELHPTVVP